MSTSEVFVGQISQVHLSRLVKLFNFAHGNGLFWWLRFVEYALTTPFSFQVSPYPTWVTRKLKRTAWWIELCGAFEKQYPNDPGAILCPRSTRIINDLLTAGVNYHLSDFFIVPGGRYLVSSSSGGISVLDLGYTSSADCKLIASVALSHTWTVQVASDGMGLLVFLEQFVSPPLYNHLVFWSMVNSFFRFGKSSIYKIYPQSETPHLTEIAHLDFSIAMDSYLLPGKAVWYGFYHSDDEIVFRVWNYRLAVNHSISFLVTLHSDNF